jgi:NADPH:quinone reductase-like Zn-dependent oxidoreductase
MIALFTKDKKVRSFLQKSRSADLEVLKKLADEGRIISVIDSIFPLDKASEAHRRAESYRTEGKIIIQVKQPD